MRELFVSPGHGICVEGVLVPAWRLVNGVSVMQAEAVERVEYFHVELDGHGILFAEGAPVESYLEIGTRGLFQNFSEAPAALDGVTSCLPRVESGFGLRGILGGGVRVGLENRWVALTGGQLPDFSDARARFIKGWFQNTVPALLREWDWSRNTVFVDFDVDLCLSTLFLMTTLRHFVPEYYFFFDEVTPDEVVAMYDFCEAHPVEFEFIACTQGDDGRPLRMLGHLRPKEFVLAQAFLEGQPRYSAQVSGLMTVV